MAKYKKRADGRYHTKVPTGRRDENGKEIRVPVYARTIPALDEKVRAIRNMKDDGDGVIEAKVLKPDDISLSAFADKVYDLFAPRQELNTRKMYRIMIDSYIKPSIGQIRVRDLRYTDCQRFIDSYRDRAETCKKLQLTMRRIEKAAIKDGIIKTPFWTDIELPQVIKEERRALTDAEKAAIVSADFSQKEKAFVYLLYGCGLRREEMLALRASDVDIKGQTVKISKAVVFGSNQPVLKDAPKSRSGFRIVPIPDSVADIVTKYVKGFPTPIDGTAPILFSHSNGKDRYMSQEVYMRFWGKIQQKILDAIAKKTKAQDTGNQAEQKQKEEVLSKPPPKVKKTRNNGAVENKDGPEAIKPKKKRPKKIRPDSDLTAHIFRHNYATMLYYSEISLLKAAELMGHTDVKMIMQIYAHLDEKKEKTVEKLNSVINF